MRSLFLAFLLLISTSVLATSLRDVLAKEVTDTHRVQSISYKKARQFMFGYLHLEDGKVEDVYCQNIYTSADGVGEYKIPDPTKINCEHTWPRSKFNENDSYNAQLTDLHHLFPSHSTTNSRRSNYPFAEIVKGEIKDCELSSIGKMPSGQKVFQPPRSHRGNVARAMFYFSVRYKIAIDPIQEHYLREWHNADPVDSKELLRNDRIREIQGNSNPFIEYPSLVGKIQDF